jgi:hypothetical protein
LGYLANQDCWKDDCLEFQNLAVGKAPDFSAEKCFVALGLIGKPLAQEQSSLKNLVQLRAACCSHDTP